MSIFINQIIKASKYIEISKIELFSKYFSDSELYKLEDSFYLESKKDGISLTFDLDYSLYAIHLYSENYESYSLFRGDIPKEVNLGMDRFEILKILESYCYTSGGDGQEISNWIKFKLEFCDIHFQFDNLNNVNLITLFNFSCL